MPQLIYPRSLIESWYRISQGKGGVSANSPRFEATAWSDSASYENPDEMGGTEGDDSDSTVDVTGGLGNYGSMRDYTGDDELGYSEVGADRQVDNQGHTTVTKNAMNTVEKENQQRSKQLVRFERIELFQGISRSARRVMSAYEAAGLENLPENVKKIYDAIEKMLAADPDQAKNPAMDAQNIVHMLEQLGIAARDAGVVPSGLPRVAVSPEMVIKMVYLEMNDFEYQRMVRSMMDGSIEGIKIVDADFITRKMVNVNANIAGTGDADSPYMPYAPQGDLDRYPGLYYDNGFARKDKASLNTRMTETTTTGDKILVSDVNNVQVSYDGETFHPSSKTQMKTMMVPNNLFAEMRDGLTSGRSKVNNEGVSSLLDTVFNGNKDAMTAQILLTGQEAFKATYGVSPERLTATSAACFLTIPLNYTQPFVGSPTCLKATASELSEIGAGFDAKRNSYGRIVTPARFELINAQDKPVTKITAKDDGLDYTPSAFFQAIASQINERVSSVSGNSLISIVLKKLYQLITGGYSVRRRPHRERTPDGRLTMVGAENEPLFHFMHFEGAGLFLQNTIRTDKSSDDSGEEMDVQVSVSNDDNVGEVAVSGNARATLYDTLVDDYLTNLTGKRVFRFAGYSPEEIPSVEDDTDTKRRFICDALMRISDSMKAAGSESYLQRMPGDTLKPVISDADKDAYGNNVTISKAWASFVRSAKENNVTFPPEAWAATVRCGLFAFVDRMLGWLNTFHGIELRADELVDYLIGSQEEFDKAKGFLTPNINMTEFFVEAMKDGLAKDAQMRSTVLKYILDMKNKMNSDILSDGVLSTVIQHVIDKYGDTSRMMTFAREIPPGDMHDFLEWCVVRFLMSGVDKDGKLIRPEDVPSSGDGIEQDDGERLIDMSLRKLGEWLRKTYLKTGNVSECMLLLFGLLLVSADLQDAVYRDAARINYSKTINNYESLSSSCFINTIKLPDALAKYGFSYLSEAIGKMSRDGGESLYMLLSIIKMDEPTDIQTLSEILGASDRSDVDARLGNVIFTLRGLSFIYFSGIK